MAKRKLIIHRKIKFFLIIILFFNLIIKGAQQSNEQNENKNNAEQIFTFEQYFYIVSYLPDRSKFYILVDAIRYLETNIKKKKYVIPKFSERCSAEYIRTAYNSFIKLINELNIFDLDLIEKIITNSMQNFIQKQYRYHNKIFSEAYWMSNIKKKRNKNSKKLESKIAAKIE